MTSRPWPGRNRRLSGMTLLEVIVAMAILAIGITGAIGAISACVRGSDAASSYSRGVLLAQQVAAEFDRQETLDAGEQSGKFDDLATTYSWQAVVSSPNDQGLYPVQITVLWDRGNRHYIFNTLLRPHTLPTALPPADSTTGGDDAVTPTSPTTEQSGAGGQQTTPSGAQGGR